MTAAATVLTGGARDAAAQGTVRSATLTADLTAGDGSATVRIDYVLESDAATADVELLGFGAATAYELVLRDGPTVVPLTADSGTRRVATLRLPPAGPDGVRRLSLEYEVARAVEHSAGRLRGRIPVASVSLPPPADGGGDRFSAELRLPDGWSLTEAFPSGLARAVGGSWSVGLPVVPAMVGFRGRSDGRQPVGLPLLVDALMGVILVALGIVGWRHLREIAA